MDNEQRRAVFVAAILIGGSIFVVVVSTMLVRFAFGTDVAWIVMLLWIAVFASIWRQNR